MGDHVHRAQAARGRRQGFDHPCGEPEGINILAECPFDAGPQHLDGDFCPGFRQPCMVHLGDRSRSNGLRELRKDRADRSAELGLDHLLRLCHREGRQLVLQIFQLFCQLAADNIGAGGEDLAELDIGRAKRGKRPRGGRQGGIALQAQPFERPAQNPRHGPQARRRVHRGQHLPDGAGALQRGQRAHQADDVVRAAHQIFQPEWSAAIPRLRLRYFTCPNPALRIIPAKVS